MMASSQEIEFMRTFGNAHKEMFEWFVVNKPELATEWLEKLEAIRWKHYLTAKEADKIVANMSPKAPWTHEQWKAAMEQHGFELEYEPCYNKCSLYVTMQGIMSASSTTLSKYVDSEDLFAVVYSLAVDKLKNATVSIRHMYGL